MARPDAELQRPAPKSAVLVDEENVLICPIAHAGLLKITDAGATHPVRVGGVVVENTAGAAVEATHHHKVALVFRFPAEALLAHREEAAILHWCGAEFADQHYGVDQHDGHMALNQVVLNFLDGH